VRSLTPIAFASPKIGDFYEALTVDQNVCGLEIAMDDLLCVSGG